MNNKKISLCLWGGWARGFIHIWVLRYLEEQWYEIQEVSGTSMWSIIGAAVALWMNADEIYDFVKAEFSYWKLIDFSFTKWFVAGDKIFKKLSEVYGKTRVNATKIPLKIVATRLKDCEMVVFEKELIIDAVRASLSVPGIFAPHEIHGETYVDGILSENLPISPLEWENVLAVSATMTLEFESNNTKSILTKAFNKSVHDNEKFSLSLWWKNIQLIRPIYDDIDFFDFHKYDTIVEIWYQAAKESLTIWSDISEK